MAYAKGNVAISRAKLDLPSLPGLKYLAAPMASVGRTLVTLKLVRLGVEYLATFMAVPEDAAIRKPHVFEEQWVFLPKFAIGAAVALTAKGFKVIKSISFHIGSKQPKWYFVVDSKFSRFMALLALTLSSLQYQSLLRLPIWAPVASMSTTPSWVFVAGKQTFWNAHSLIIVWFGSLVNGNNTGRERNTKRSA